MLTKRQKEVLSFIQSYIAKSGYGPTLDEISEEFDMGSASAAHQHVEALKRKGFLKRIPHQARSIHLYKQEHGVAEIPLTGRIAMGEPIESFEVPETLKVPQVLLCGSGSHYALEAEGDSMVEDGILDGDIIILKHQSTADNGDIVVAQVQGKGATLKRFYNYGDRVELRPKSPDTKHSSKFYPYGQIEIQGKFCGLIRKGGG